MDVIKLSKQQFCAQLKRIFQTIVVHSNEVSFIFPLAVLLLMNVIRHCKMLLPTTLTTYIIHGQPPLIFNWSGPFSELDVQYSSNDYNHNERDHYSEYYCRRKIC